MMNRDNMNGAMKIASWTIGVVLFLITIYTVFHVPLVKADAKEKEERQAADDEIKKDVADKLLAISKDTTETKVMLAKIQTSLEYIVKKEYGQGRQN